MQTMRTATSPSGIFLFRAIEVMSVPMASNLHSRNSARGIDYTHLRGRPLAKDECKEVEVNIE